MGLRGYALPSLSGPPDRQYFDHLSLFPSPQELREFLSGLLIGREPSRAHRLAARLMTADEGITHLHLTTNLDDMAVTSLRELGLKPAVLDHPAEILQRFDLWSPMPQVLHLHGTCAHPDFCNLGEEIRRRTVKLDWTMHTILSTLCPIVVGYSGWKDDAFMRWLRAYFQATKGSAVGQLYWFCYTQESAAALPRWLRADPRVRLVVPSSNGTDQGLLPAERVFETLLEARAAEQPAASWFVNAPEQPAPASAAMALSSAEEAVDRGAFQEALAAIRPLPPQQLTEGTRAFYDAVLEKVYVGARETSPADALEANQLRRMALVVGDGAAGKTWLVSAELRGRWSRVVYAEGVSLLALGRSEEALFRFDEVLSLRKSWGEFLRGRAAHALNGKAAALFALGRREEALRTWSGLLEIDPGTDAELREALEYGRVNLGLALHKLGRAEDAAAHWLVVTDEKRAFRDRADAPPLRALRERAAESLRALDGHVPIDHIDRGHVTVNEIVSLLAARDIAGGMAVPLQPADSNGRIYDTGVTDDIWLALRGRAEDAAARELDGLIPIGTTEALDRAAADAAVATGAAMAAAHCPSGDPVQVVYNADTFVNALVHDEVEIKVDNIDNVYTSGNGDDLLFPFAVPAQAQPPAVAGPSTASSSGDEAQVIPWPAGCSRARREARPALRSQRRPAYAAAA